MSEQLTLSIETPETGRLDKALAAALASHEMAAGLGLSRVRVQALIKEGCVVHEGHGVAILDPNHPTQAGEGYRITLPTAVAATPQAESIPLDIMFEDEDMLVINKPAGLVVHPAAGNWDGTLVNALLGHCGDSLSGIGGVARPGIVHRLDKDTSGLMVVAKNDFAHQKLTAQFSNRSLSRVYQALVWGVMNPLKGEIEGAIGRHPRSRQKMAVVPYGGKDALTHYETIDIFSNLVSLVSCKLETGRTHQIRVHLASVHHPVVGDPMYGTRKKIEGEKKARGLVAVLHDFPRQALHAGEIKFIHPRSNKTLTFKAPLPLDMKVLLKSLKSVK